MIAIVGLTLQEMARKKVMQITLLMSLLFLGLFWYASWSIMRLNSSAGDAPRLLTGIGLLALGLYFANFSSAFLVIFSAVGTIGAEIESGILLAVLPRPVRRWEVYLGKYLGYAICGVLYSVLLFFSVLLIAAYQGGYPLGLGSLLQALLAFALAPLALTALTMLGSSYLQTVGNGILMTLLFIIGAMGGFAESFLSNSVLAYGAEKMGLVVSLVMPADSLYRRAIYELMGGSLLPFGIQQLRTLGPFQVSNAPSAAFLAYAAGYTLLVLVWGCCRFTNRDI